MVKLIKKNILFAFVIFLTNIFFYSSANAEEKCIKVVTHEWQGENNIADPAVMVAMDDTFRTFTTNEGLVRVDNEFTPQPFLATSWESNADATEWTFHLRKGVKFHDGSDLDAGDVVWSYKRLLDPEVKSGSLSKARLLSKSARLPFSTILLIMSKTVTRGILRISAISCCV